MRKPNYGQERVQRERDKVTKTQAKEQKRQEQREAKLSPPPNQAERDNEGAGDSPR
ncbi:hypothetical protein [Roseomonas chloroacetimidivorans]|uniref:hypothetical protein n=1 Tax=Roseomonas chloroacetimidivorans TaxID=1766656 RepID=UPI003C71D172